MEEPFILDVSYKGEELALESRLQLTGYTHRFVVQVQETEIWFERDEEGGYRAIVPPHTTEKEASRLDKGLLEAIAGRIAQILA